MTQRIESFRGEYRWLSNFWPCTINPPWGGGPYSSVEQAYQASKTDDLTEQEAIKNCTTPGRAKRLGRLITIRSDWGQVKYGTMRNLVFYKFSIHNWTLRIQLMLTGDAHLEEGNAWGDTYWGVCAGIGENRLGKILMEVRKDVRLRVREMG